MAGSDNIAERIINGDYDGAKDDLGLPCPTDPDDPSVEYMVKRILIRFPHIYQYNNAIYIGRELQRENPNNLVRLTNVYNSYAKGAKHMLVWNKLREVLPVFDDSKIWISPTLLWNMKTCEFEEQDPQENYV